MFDLSLFTQGSNIISDIKISIQLAKVKFHYAVIEVLNSNRMFHSQISINKLKKK